MARGFAAMTPEKRREAARKGGIAAHALGKAHVFTSEQARIAGSKGGIVTGQRYDMEELGRRGGNTRWGNEQEPESDE